MTAIREFVKVENHELNIKLPDEFDYEEVEVIIMPRAIHEDFIPWSEKELSSIGKIGMHSSLFEEDDEDYSKW